MNVNIINTLFMLEKCENLLKILTFFFSTKNNGVFDNVVSVYLLSGCLNDVVSVTIL